ncbi:p21-activated protein kinase [Pelomyxa schiedti]|nr:p21-activated protein kinase [Pelomyxa schiedti]
MPNGPPTGSSARGTQEQVEPLIVVEPQLPFRTNPISNRLPDYSWIILTCLMRLPDEPPIVPPSSSPCNTAQKAASQHQDHLTPETPFIEPHPQMTSAVTQPLQVPHASQVQLPLQLATVQASSLNSTVILSVSTVTVPEPLQIEEIPAESRRVVAIWEICPRAEDVQSKMAAMIAHRHPNIVEFIESYLAEDCLWIVTEFMSGGCLTDVVSHFPELKLTEHQISYILLCVMKALTHIHGLNYIHRAITSSNVLLSLDGAVKLVDFGKLHSQPYSTFWLLHREWTLRNSILHEPGIDQGYSLDELYTATTDVWSTGILCMEMVEGEVPYQEGHPMRALFLIPMKGIPPLKNPEQVSPQLASFISECLKPAGTRPSSAKMLTHEFLSKASCSQSLAPVVEMAIRLNNTIPPPSPSPTLLFD